MCLTPDQKVACSNHVRVSDFFYLSQNFIVDEAVKILSSINTGALYVHIVWQKVFGT